MAVFTDQNLVNYKKYVDDLSIQIKAWEKYLSTAAGTITKGTGSKFRTDYAKGKAATSRITAVIDILQSLKKDLNKLVSDAQAFYTTSYNASKK